MFASSYICSKKVVSITERYVVNTRVEIEPKTKKEIEVIDKTTSITVANFRYNFRCYDGLRYGH